MSLHVTATPEYVTIMVLNPTLGRSLGTASADLHPLNPASANCWWINRVLVTQQAHRGQGLGGQMLDALLLEILNQKGRSVVVTPGGYGGDPILQVRFYENHGFVKIGEGFTAHWLWTATDEERSKLNERIQSRKSASLPNLEATT